MNAATVIGPRSRTKSAIRTPQSAMWLFLSHGHEHFGVSAPDTQLREMAGLHFLKLALCVDRAAHGPAVDRQNHIARAQTRSEEHTSELQSHSFISYPVFC